MATGNGLYFWNYWDQIWKDFCFYSSTPGACEFWMCNFQIKVLWLRSQAFDLESNVNKITRPVTAIKNLRFVCLRSSMKFQGHTRWKIYDLNPIWVRLLDWSQLSNPCPAPSHYLKQCIIVNWPLRNKLLWNSNQNTKVFIHENAFEKIVCDMVAILPRGRWVKGQWVYTMLCVIEGEWVDTGYVRYSKLQIRNWWVDLWQNGQ